MHGARRMHRAHVGKRAFGISDLLPTGDPIGSIISQVLGPKSTAGASLSLQSSLPISSTSSVASSSSTVSSSSLASSSTTSVQPTTSSSTSSSTTSFTTTSATPTSNTALLLESSSSSSETVTSSSVLPSSSGLSSDAESPKSFLQNTTLSAAVFTLLAIIVIVLLSLLATASIRAKRRRRNEEEVKEALSNMMVADDFSDDGSHDASHVHRARQSTFNFSSAGDAGRGAFGRGTKPMPDAPKPAHTGFYAETGPLMTQQAFADAPFNPSLFSASIAPTYQPNQRNPIKVLVDTMPDKPSQSPSSSSITSPVSPSKFPPSPTGTTHSLSVPSDPRLVRRGSLLDNVSESSSPSETSIHFFNPTAGLKIPNAEELPDSFGSHDDDENSEDDKDPYGGLEYAGLQKSDTNTSLKVANK